jgi:CheY-like chemotaxis protein
MAAGDESEMIPLSSSRDELDAIAYGINVLADELRWATARASEAKNAFLRTASHEIRTPIASILGIVDLLDRDPVSDTDRADLLARLRANCRALLSLVTNVLDLSRIEADKIAFTFEAVSPLELVQEVVQSLEQDARAKGVAVRIQFEMGSSMAISTDRLRLRQILVNVIANAVKFTPPPQGEIRISMGIHPVAGRDRLTVDVADTGVGIAPDQIPRLFEPFGQADAVARAHGGTGLGLALSRRLAEQLGGSLVLVSSEVGRGTTFRIAIDAHDSGAADSHPTSSPDSDRASAGLPALIGLQILLAEDNADLQLAIGRALALEGAALSLAVNGREAIEMAERSKFDIIIMDLLMPVMSGLEATRALRSAGSRVPVIAISADATPRTRTAAIDAGCNAFLCKPFDSGELVAAIRFLHSPPDTEWPAPPEPLFPAPPIAEPAGLSKRPM